MVETIFGISLSILLIAWAIYLVVGAWTIFSEHACSMETMKDFIKAYDNKFLNMMDHFERKYGLNEKEIISEAKTTKTPPPEKEYEPVRKNERRVNMLEKEEARKFPVTCPHCKSEQHIGDFSWLGIFDDLDQFGKTVMECTNCRTWYIIREEDDTGPFVTK